MAFGVGLGRGLSAIARGTLAGQQQRRDREVADAWKQWEVERQNEALARQEADRVQAQNNWQANYDLQRGQMDAQNARYDAAVRDKQEEKAANEEKYRTFFTWLTRTYPDMDFPYGITWDDAKGIIADRDVKAREDKLRKEREAAANASANAIKSVTAPVVTGSTTYQMPGLDRVSGANANDVLPAVLMRRDTTRPKTPEEIVSGLVANMGVISKEDAAGVAAALPYLAPKVRDAAAIGKDIASTEVLQKRAALLGKDFDWYDKDMQSKIDHLATMDANQAQQLRLNARKIAQYGGRGNGDTWKMLSRNETLLRGQMGAIAEEIDNEVKRWVWSKPDPANRGALIAAAAGDPDAKLNFLGPTEDAQASKNRIARLKAAYQDAGSQLMNVQGQMGAPVGIQSPSAVNVTITQPQIPTELGGGDVNPGGDTAWATKYTAMIKPKGAAITMKTSEGYQVQDVLKKNPPLAAKARTHLGAIVDNATRAGITLTDTQVADKLYDYLIAQIQGK